MSHLAGVARHVEPPCPPHVGFDHTEKVCDSEVVWICGYASSSGWKRKMAYLCHGNEYYAGGPTVVDLNWKPGVVGTGPGQRKDSPATAHSVS